MTAIAFWASSAEVTSISDSELTPIAAPMPRACVLMLAIDREAVWWAFGPIWKISFWPPSKVAVGGERRGGASQFTGEGERVAGAGHVDGGAGRVDVGQNAVGVGRGGRGEADVGERDGAGGDRDVGREIGAGQANLAARVSGGNVDAVGREDVIDLGDGGCDGVGIVERDRDAIDREGAAVTRTHG